MSNPNEPTVDEVRRQMGEFLQMARSVAGETANREFGAYITTLASAVETNLAEFLEQFPGMMQQLQAETAASEAEIARQQAADEEGEKPQEAAKNVEPAPPVRPPLDPSWPPRLREEFLRYVGLIAESQKSVGESVNWSAWIEQSVQLEAERQPFAQTGQPPSAPAAPESVVKTWNDWISHSNVLGADKGWDEFFQ